MSSSDSDSILWSMLFGGRLKIVGIYQGLTSCFSVFDQDVVT